MEVLSSRSLKRELNEILRENGTITKNFKFYSNVALSHKVVDSEVKWINSETMKIKFRDENGKQITAFVFFRVMEIRLIR